LALCEGSLLALGSLPRPNGRGRFWLLAFGWVGVRLGLRALNRSNTQFFSQMNAVGLTLWLGD
ncbi:MAG: hypothetical protein D6765_00410, partial [Bacteroidetes bacterium]